MKTLKSSQKKNITNKTLKKNKKLSIENKF